MKFISIIHKSNIHLYQSTTSAGLRSVSHKAAVLWNELPLTKTYDINYSLQM